MNPIHVIENKVPEDVMKIPKFNCSNKCGQFFFGLIEGMYQIYINYNLVFIFIFFCIDRARTRFNDIFFLPCQGNTSGLNFHTS